MLLVTIVLTAAFAVLVALPAAYLAFLAAVTLIRRRRPGTILEPARRRFAILVPAHDEAAAIGRTIEAIFRLDYPHDAYSVHVVADNCTDATAAIARSRGACVHERTDPSRRGKGAALNWLVRAVSEEVECDAIVVLDADTEPAPNLLRALARPLSEGAFAVQALNLVRASASDAPLVRIRELAFRLVCDLRPRAYAALGASIALHGNGMCFATPLVRDGPWSETSVVEDGELLLRLVRARRRVVLADDTAVHSAMPPTFAAARAQAIRWERGRFDHFADGASLFLRGVRARDVGDVVVGAAVIVPPFSVLAGGTVAGLVLGIVCDGAVLCALSVAAGLCLAAYVGRGAALGGMGPTTIARIAAWAPLYVLWKLWILGLAACGAGRGEWSRTTRTP